MRFCSVAEGLSLSRGRTALQQPPFAAAARKATVREGPESFRQELVSSRKSGPRTVASYITHQPPLTPDLPSSLGSISSTLLTPSSAGLGFSASSFPTLSRSVILSSSLAAPLTMAATATATEPVDVLGKAATGNPDILGDCPFTHRVLLTLEEAHIPYNLKLVDTSNKPQWFLEANPEGKVPVLKRDGKWLADSDVIVKALAEDYPEAKKLDNTPEEAGVSSGLFGAFVRFLKGTGSEEDLLAQLKELDSAIAKSGGPFVAGTNFTAVDARIAPALHHIRIALEHYKNWKTPDTLTHLHEYIKAVQSRESFKKTAAPPEVVIAGWDRALGVKPAA